MGAPAGNWVPNTERYRAVLRAGTATGAAGVVALMMHLDVWLVVVVSVSAAASVSAWASTWLRLDRSLRYTSLPGSEPTDDEVRDGLMKLAVDFGPKAVSSARQIIDDEVEDRWLVELAHQRLDRVAGLAAEHRRGTIAIIGLCCLAVVAMVAGVLTQNRFWALTVVVAGAGAAAAHASDRCRAVTGSRLFATVATQRPMSRDHGTRPAVPPTSVVCPPEHPAQLRAVRAWCVTHLTGVTALVSLSTVV